MRLRKLTALALVAGTSSISVAFAQDVAPEDNQWNGGNGGGGGSQTDVVAPSITKTFAAEPTETALAHVSFSFVVSASDVVLGTSGTARVDTEFGQVYLFTPSVAKADVRNNAISWAANGADSVANINVTALRLWQMESDDTSRGKEVCFSSYPAEDPNLTSDKCLVPISSVSNVNSGSISINYNAKGYREYVDSALYIAIDWISASDGSRAGRSYTPFFAVIGASENAAKEALQSASKVRGFVNFAEDEISTSDAISPEESDPGSELPTIGGGSSGGGPSDSNDASTPASSRKKSGGLSVGAIIGIAVGAGAAVIIAIGAFIFFCLRRRRNKKNRHSTGVRSIKPEATDHVHEGGYDSAPANQEFMAEKESNQRVAESPHSPYSDNVEGTAVAGPSTDHHRSYTPYDDPATPVTHAASPVRSPVRSLAASPPPVAPGHDGGMPRAGSSTPLGLSHSVAALVEDGMTEEEIRRLEEEERALDVAIAEQQASRHR